MILIRLASLTSRKLFLAFWLLIFATCPFTYGQVATGSITGRITDPSGALLPGSAVTLTRTDTGLVLKTQANGDAIYSFGSLQTGPYRIEVTQAGFKKAETELTLTVGQTAQMDLVMELGSNSETVTIQSEGASQLHTDNATLNFVVGAKQVSDLPLNGRNPYGLAALSPGIAPGGSFGTGVSTTRGALVAAATNNFEANGGIAGSNEILLDGLPIALCCQGQPALTPSVEVVDQFSVITSVPSAQFGRTSGGILNIVTKTGTNGLHGDVYEYFRNDQLDAANFFTKRTGTRPIPTRNDFRLPHRFNQFGGFVSGPIVFPKVYDGRNRSFFTFGYEGTRNTTNNFVTTTVPTVLERQGVFTEAPLPIYSPYLLTNSGTTYTRGLLPAACSGTTCYPAGRYIPNLDPTAQKLLALYPLPTAPGTTNNYSYADTYTDLENQYNFRIDHNFSGNQRSFVRGTRDVNNHHENDLFNQPTGPNGVNQQLLAYLFAVGHTWVVSPSTLLQFSYGFGYQQNHQTPQNYTGFNSPDFGFSSNFASQQQIPGLPYIIIAGSTGFSSIGNTANNYNSFVHYSHFFESTAVLQRGRQTLTAGYDGRLILENEQSLGNPLGNLSYDATLTNGPNPNASVPANQSQFGALAAFLIGVPTSSSIQRQQTIALSQWYNAVFLQDDWRIRPNLTVNLGARYEIETGFRERYNRWADIDPGLPNPFTSAGLPLQGGAQYLGIPGNPSRTWQTFYNKVAPRVGFSYSAAPNTVVRGGFGILYLPTSQRIFGAQTLGFSQITQATYNAVSIPTTTTANPFPSGVALPAGSAAGVQAGTGTSASGLRYNNPVAYYEQWNLGVEQQFTTGIVLHLNYAGSHGVKLPINVRLNDLPPQSWGAPGSAAQIGYLQQQVPNPFAGKVSSGALAASTVQRSQLLVPYPQYVTNTGLANGSLTINQDNIGSASFNALQASLTFQRSKNLTGTVSYTWSKLIGNVVDVTTGSFNPTGQPSIQSFYHLHDLERSVLATDIPHRIIGNAIYYLPVGRGQRFLGSDPGWANQIVGGWRLNAIAYVQSGYALGLTQSGGQAFSGSRPTYVPGVNPLTTGSTHNRLGGAGQSQGYFNPAAFRTSVAFELGNVPRSASQLRGPLSFQDDLSAIKDFPIHDSLSLQFRLEAFNLLNRVQFGLPNTTYNSTTFGQITTQANLPRNVQAALQLYF